MRPAFGWTLLSPEAIRRAEAQLREDIQGVRDEIGFLLIHQAYANRFFPGTSVQQTRLRYALFVPWIYKNVSSRPFRERQQSIDTLVLEEEVRLTGRLLNSGETDGVIGKRVYHRRRASSQPATMVYWTALRSWGLLRHLEDGSLPSRSSIHAILGSDRSRFELRDDDGAPLEEGRTVFVNLPKPPDSWTDSGKKLTFRLRSDEMSFLRQRMIATRREGTPERSLLSRLSERPGHVTSASNAWDKRVSEVADSQDISALQRARRVAALAAIGRAVYAALVEELREKDGSPTSRLHRTRLMEIVEEYRGDALELTIGELLQDVRELPSYLVRVVVETQQWLQARQSPEKLLEPYAKAEERRKGNRARLAPTIMSKQRRAEWDADEHPLAEPLHYRWGIVRRMLQDLNNDE